MDRLISRIYIHNILAVFSRIGAHKEQIKIGLIVLSIVTILLHVSILNTRTGISTSGHANLVNNNQNYAYVIYSDCMMWTYFSKTEPVNVKLTPECKT